MSSAPDDRLTATRQLVGILSLSIRPNGTFNGTLRDRGLAYRFTGLKGLVSAVNRWLNEVLAAPAAEDPDCGPLDKHESAPAEQTDEERPWQ